MTDDVFHWTKEQREACGVDTLPGTLEEALDELAKDDVIRRALGEHIYTVYDRAGGRSGKSIASTSLPETERYLYTL